MKTFIAICAGLLLVIFALSLAYLFSVGIAWLIITGFSLSYNPWTMGLGILGISWIIHGVSRR